MAHDFVGYLLDALDSDERAEVEAALRADAAARARLESVERTLAPLAWDRKLDAPTGLAERTLARVAGLPGPSASPSLSPPTLAGGWPRRRLVELAVAAVLLLTVTGLLGVWLARLRGFSPGQQGAAVSLVECKDNLQKLFLPLRSYADTNQGHFPNVAKAAQAPRNTGALVYPLLQDAKLLPADARFGCPSANTAGVKDVQAMDDAAYRTWAENMKNCYAYTLGFVNGNQVVSMKVEEGKPSSLLPLMADRPPPNPSLGNSLHHGGQGQHVLYADGHVTFAQARHVGYNQDDIYLNRAGKVAAGHDWADAVLSVCTGPP